MSVLTPWVSYRIHSSLLYIISLSPLSLKLIFLWSEKTKWLTTVSLAGAVVIERQ